MQQTKFRTVIADDDLASRALIEHHVKKSPLLELVQSFENGAQVFDYLVSDQKVDILFLDVMMPELTGLQVIKSLPRQPEVIIVSSEPEFAADAYDLYVTDFMVKPVTPERFNKAVVRAMQNLSAEPQINVDEDEFFVKQNKKMVKVKTAEILYIEAMSDYVVMVTPTGKHIINSTMSAMEAKLDQRFLRVHRSYIVNLKKIEQIEDSQALIHGKQIPISQTYHAELYARIKML